MITNEKAKFGEFGGQYVPEAVMQALIELEEEFNKARNDQQFMEEYRLGRGAETQLPRL